MQIRILNHFRNALIMIGILLSGCFGPETYQSKEITLYVVDANSNKPLEGVIAVATWDIEKGNLVGINHVGTLKALESISDNNGRIFFPAWSAELNKSGHVSTENPWIHFYKPGYKSVHRVDGNTYYYTEGNENDSRISASTIIELPLLQDNEESHIKNIMKINSTLRKLVSYPEGCQWKNIPNMWRIMIDEQERFNEKGYKWPNTALNFLLRNSNNQLFIQKGGKDCPYPADVISDLGKH